MCLGQSKHRRDLSRLQIAWRIGSGTLDSCARFQWARVENIEL